MITETKVLCVSKKMSINSSFFEHYAKHKYTWQITSGQQSMIDYIITNRAPTPQTILDVRKLKSASDHKLLLCNIRKFKVKALGNSIELCYENGLTRIH